MEFYTKELMSSEVNMIVGFQLDYLKSELSRDVLENKILDVLNKDNEKIYIAVSEDEVIGYIYANTYDVLYREPIANIVTFVLNMNKKHNGVGKTLIDAVENWAKEKNMKEVRLVSDKNRTHAHSLFKKLGYEINETDFEFKKSI